MASSTSQLASVAGALARGGGGRSSFSGVTASVFGATGFLGRYVVNALGRVGSTVVVPYRGDELNPRHLKLMGDVGQIVPTPCELRDEASVRRSVANSTVVVNLVGKLYPTIHYKLADVHVAATRRLAEIAREEGVPHFVHVSTNVPAAANSSEWLRTKVDGEAAVRAVYPAATVVRPTDMFGAEDRFLIRMATAVLNWPVVPLPGNGDAKMQPVYVVDVAKLVAAAARDPAHFAGKTLELGGPDVITLRECYEFVLRATRRDATLFPVPGVVTQALAALAGMRVPVLNPSPTWTVDGAKMEAAGNVLNVAKPGVLRFADFGYLPTSITSRTGEEVLRRFRKGGDRSSLFYVD
jgi:NADH dehydrogenase (ubiquinone) 1 alpha subcomplex subunit 9